MLFSCNKLHLVLGLGDSSSEERKHPRYLVKIVREVSNRLRLGLSDRIVWQNMCVSALQLQRAEKNATRKKQNTDVVACRTFLSDHLVVDSQVFVDMFSSQGQLWCWRRREERFKRPTTL